MGDPCPINPFEPEGTNYTFTSETAYGLTTTCCAAYQRWAQGSGSVPPLNCFAHMCLVIDGSFTPSSQFSRQAILGLRGLPALERLGSAAQSGVAVEEIVV